MSLFWLLVSYFGSLYCVVGCDVVVLAGVAAGVVCVMFGVKNGGPKTVKNGPRVWAFCKIEFPGIQKPVQIFGQKMAFFKKCGNRGVGVIWRVRGVVLFLLLRFCCGWLCVLILVFVGMDVVDLVVLVGCYLVVLAGLLSVFK